MPARLWRPGTARPVALALLLSAAAQLSTAWGAVYYVSPSGSDSQTGSASSPWLTFAHALAALQPGDSLLLADGTYQQPLQVTTSGSPGAPITIAAVNDGKAVVDGAGTAVPCAIFGSPGAHVHDIVLAGIECRSSNADVLDVDYADSITVRRVSAHQPAANATAVALYGVSNSLLEDMVASGAGAYTYFVSTSSGVVVRRCFGWQVPSAAGNYTNFLAIEVTQGASAENCVGALSPVPGAPGVATAQGITLVNSSGVSVMGSVIYGFADTAYVDGVSSGTVSVAGNSFIDDVAINQGVAFYQRADSDLEVSRLTAVNGANGFDSEVDNTLQFDAGYVLYARVTDSSFVSENQAIGVFPVAGVTPTLTHDYNLVFDAGEAYAGTDGGPHELGVDPHYDTATFGKGAYLFTPSGSPLRSLGSDGGRIGAEVLYAWVDGGLTSQPLWPWPMESRVQAELGMSVTWESDGGLWRTLQGVYPATFQTVSPGVYTVGCSCAAGKPLGAAWALLGLGLLARRARSSRRRQAAS